VRCFISRCRRMIDAIIVLPSRHVPPPLPHNGGGWWYLKRKSDGAILLKRNGDYRQFDSDSAARSYAKSNVAEAVHVRFMPKMRAH
jgi:hypothetical protein